MYRLRLFCYGSSQSHVAYGLGCGSDDTGFVAEFGWVELDAVRQYGREDLIEFRFEWIEEEITGFCRNRAQLDDITVVIVKVEDAGTS